jgi:hypothetical protein
MKNLIKFALLLFFLLSNFTLFAQPGDVGDGGLEGDDPAPAPINSKIIYLAIVGIIYVAYTFKKKIKRA